MKQPLFEYDDEADEITVDFGSGTRRVELYVNANKVASLRAEVEALREDHKYACDVADNLRAEIKTLRNQAVANAEDAERYRIVKNSAIFGCDLSGMMHWSFMVYPHRQKGFNFDLAIDALRGEGE